MDKKDNLLYPMAKKLAELCPGVLWKVALVIYRTLYLAEVYKQNVKGIT
jgi:hypothetical protein